MVHFAMLQTTKYCSRIQVKTHSTMLAIAPPKWLVLRKSCELIVLRVVREVIIFNNSNFTAVKKNGFDANGGLNPPSFPPLATPLHSLTRPDCMIGKWWFPVAGANMWNNLSFDFTSAESLEVFRQHLKTFLFSHSYPDIHDLLSIIDYHHCFLVLFF